jgi:hypothetical protein
VSRMKPGQKQIYFISGESKDQLAQSPFVEKLLKKDYEVSSPAVLPGCYPENPRDISVFINQGVATSAGTARYPVHGPMKFSGEGAWYSRPFKRSNRAFQSWVVPHVIPGF